MAENLTPEVIRERLREFGMTDQELEIWYALAGVAGQMLNLPQLHPTERAETVADFHRLQERVLARPGLRAAGWPKGD